MILESLKAVIDSERSKFKSTKVVRFELPYFIEPKDIKGIISQMDECQDLIDKIQQVSLSPPQINLRSLVDNYYSDLRADENKKQQELDRKYNEEIHKREEEYNRQREISLSKIKPIQEKYERLCEYKQKIYKMLDHYNITSEEVDIAEDITADELDALLTSALDSCKWSTSEGVGNLAEKLNIHNVAPVAIGTLIGYAFFKWLAAIGVFGYIAFMTIKTKNKVNDLKIAYYLMCNTDVSAYIDEITEDYSDITKEVLPESSLDKEYNEACSVAINYLGEFNKLIQSDIEELRNMRIDAISKVNERLTYLQDKLDEYKNSQTKFGESCYEFPVFNNSFLLGKEDRVFNKYYELAIENYVFRGDSIEMLNFCKTLLWNYLFAIKERRLSIEFYDPEYFGAEFTDFIKSNELDEVINKKPYLDGIEGLLKDLQAEVSENVGKLGGIDLNDYNQHRFSKGMTTIDYHLLIVRSGLDDFYKSKIAESLLAQSYKYGVLLWVIDPGYSGNVSCVFREPFPGVEEPWTVSQEEASNFYKSYVYILENSKVNTLDYMRDYIDKVCPDEKIWTFNTKNGVEVNLGFKDGDPSKAINILLGDDYPHMLIGGRSGSGKSATLDEVLYTIARKYPPSELKIIHVDFKRTEALKFKEGTGSVLPHSLVLSGTENGNYALSIFEYVIEEMNRRNALFSKHKVSNVRAYREVTGEVLCRIIILFDEYQAAWIESDPRTGEKLSKVITTGAKKLRSAGIHMIFASQGTSGTLSKEVFAQYPARVCHKAENETSNALVGNNDAVARIKENKGWLVTNLSGGELPEKNELWRIPYIESGLVVKKMKELKEMAIRIGEHTQDIVVYDDTERFPGEKLQSVIGDWEALKTNKLNIALGDRIEYSSNPRPVNITFQPVASAENMMCVCSEEKDMLNIALTLVDNFKSKGINSYLIHDRDLTTREVLEPHKYVNEVAGEFIEMDENDLFSNLKEIADSRIDSNDIAEPFYVIGIRWDSLDGFNGQNPRLQQTYPMIISRLNEANIHLIAIFKDLRDIPRAIQAMFLIKVACKCSETDSDKILGNKNAFILKDTDFGYLNYNNKISGFRLYQHKFTGTLTQREI